MIVSRWTGVEVRALRNERAYAAYRKWGWRPVGSLRPGWENAQTFDVLIRDLPL